MDIFFQNEKKLLKKTSRLMIPRDVKTIRQKKLQQQTDISSIVVLFIQIVLFSGIVYWFRFRIDPEHINPMNGGNLDVD